ncbi:MAG TPA: hypothetical protein VF002_10110 [Gaiellaceae bacterium]
MGSDRPSLRLSLCLALALLALLGLPAAQATGARGAPAACTGGASSIRAERLGGRIVVSAPATSGCIPR